MSHPSLTPAQAERLEMLAEEAGEIVQAVTKILRHGYESNHPAFPNRTNKGDLRHEIQDLLAVRSAMQEEGDFGDPTWPPGRDWRAVWMQKLQHTHHQPKEKWLG